MFYDIENVDIQEVTKNNGVLCTGLVVKRTDANISPNIYLEGYYQKYLNGMEMEKVLTEIMKDYHMASMRIKESDKEILSYIQDSDYYYQNAFVRVVNYERNKDIADTMTGFVRDYKTVVTKNAELRNENIKAQEQITELQSENKKLREKIRKIEERTPDGRQGR